MGVPMTWDILTTSRRPRAYDVFPYLYEGTTEEDYKLAVLVEETNCCVTFAEFSKSKENTNEEQNDLLMCKFTADDNDDDENLLF
jgi:hypothetical protein